MRIRENASGWLLLVLLGVGCSGGSDDPNPAPPPPPVLATADLNGTWTCLRVEQIEGQHISIGLDDRITITDGQVQMQEGDAGRSRVLLYQWPPPSNYRYELYWYQNVVTPAGVAFGYCRRFYGHARMVLSDTCEGWRFAVIDPDTLEGYVTWLSVGSSRHTTLVTLARTDTR